MRSTTRIAALGLAGLLLAACHHKDKDAPLAFVPADTPYVVANLDVLDDATRNAFLAQADAQMPAQIAQLKATAEAMANGSPGQTQPEPGQLAKARLLKALVTELDGKTLAAFAQNTGLDIKGHSAFYGLGLAPVVRFELTDPKAFEAFIGRMETAYGKPFDKASIGGQDYRRFVAPDSNVQIVIALTAKYAVAAMLPSDAPDSQLRLALGLDRPAKSLQDDGRLDKLAKNKGYQPWVVSQLDMVRLLPLVAGGKDPLFIALRKTWATTESAKTGEPVANLLPVDATCEGDAARIAARVPSISFGYTHLDATHQDTRLDVALAPDLTQAFSGLKVELPGLGTAGTAPFDLALALPVAQLRTLLSAQADAVAAKPFSCPTLLPLNQGFSKIGLLSQQAAVPPVGDLLGVHALLDSFEPGDADHMPKFSGRIVIGTNNPAGLLAMAQVTMPVLGQLRPTADGKPVALPADLTAHFGMPVWVAMGQKSLALAIGDGEDAKLADALGAATGDTGRLARVALSGDMYLSWMKTMASRLEQPSLQAAGSDDATTARTKAQLDSMLTQAARIRSINGEAHMESDGLVLTSQTELR